MDAPTPTLSRLRRLIRLAWYLAALATLALLIISLPGYLGNHFPSVQSPTISAPLGRNLFTLLTVMASLTCALISLSLAAMLFFRRGEDNMALFVSFYLLGYCALMSGPLEATLLWWNFPVEVAYPVQTAVLILPTAILFFTFPSGHFVPRWSRWLTILATPLALAALLRPGREWSDLSSTAIRLINVGILLLLATGIFAQIYRYRRVSGVVERQQTKWVIAGLVLWSMYLLMSAIPWYYLGSLPADAPTPWWVPLTSLTWWLALAILPISLTIAVMRNRLFAIDIIIRRTLVYSLLTAVLVLIYLGDVVLLQAAFGAVSGQQSPLAIVVSTLLIAALFSPLRRRIQDAIDRRFYRPRYDAAQALGRFADYTREAVDLESLRQELLLVITETVQPDSLSLWVRPDEKSA